MIWARQDSCGVLECPRKGKVRKQSWEPGTTGSQAHLNGGVELCGPEASRGERSRSDRLLDAQRAQLSVLERWKPRALRNVRIYSLGYPSPSLGGSQVH